MRRMQGLPENVPMPANSFVIFLVLCLFILGGIAFAEFMQRREKRSVAVTEFTVRSFD
jgi:hypothetical protein